MKEKEEDDDYIEIKAILLGEHGVGKTNLINVTIGLDFDEKVKETINSTFVRKNII